jgi:membrane protease YdiL (CAAX protease family)
MAGIGQSDQASRLAPGSRATAAIGLAIALVLPFIPLGRWIAPGEAIGALLAREVVWWAWAASVLAWLLLAERQSLSSIGFRRPTWRTFAFALLAAVIATAIMTLHFLVLGPALHLDTSVAGAVRSRILHTPYWYRVLLVLRAAVVEEILFRAYLMEKVRQLTGSWILAILVSVAAFTLAHLSGWGLVQLIPVFAAAVVFALLYWRRRDTPCNIIAHFITDGLGFLTA